MTDVSVVLRATSAAAGALLFATCTAASPDPAGLRFDEVGGVTFLAQTAPPNAVMEALFQGRVIVDDAGCMRLESPDPATVVWPYGFTLERRRRDMVVLDGNGREVGVAGGSFRFGGGEVPTLHEGLALNATTRARALERCPGRFWIVGDILSAQRPDQS